MGTCCTPAMPESFIASITDENVCLLFNRQLQHIPSVFSIQTRHFSFQIQILHFTYNAKKMDTGFHQHRFIELAFPLRDMRYFIGKDKEDSLEIDSGIILIPPGQSHCRQSVSRKGLCFGAVFDMRADSPELLSEFFHGVQQKKYRMQISEKMLQVLQEITENFAKSGDEFSGSVQYMLFNRLFIELLRYNFPDFFSSKPESLPANQAEAIRIYLEHNLQSRYILKDLSRRMELSERHLNRLFSNVYGLSIKQWIIRERIRLAAHLLLTSKSPVKSIADSCGFNNMSYFSRLFFRFYSMTPAAYRRKG